MDLVEINYYKQSSDAPCFTPLKGGLNKHYVNTRFISSLSELKEFKRLGGGEHFITYAELKMNNGDIFHIDEDSFDKFIYRGR